MTTQEKLEKMISELDTMCFECEDMRTEESMQSAMAHLQAAKRRNAEVLGIPTPTKV